MLGTKLIKAAAGNAAEETDPNFNQTVLLLHGDGSNGAQNNTFLDSSSNGFSITRNGNTTQGTFSPFSAPDGRWSNFFDGSGDNLSGIGTTSDFNFVHNTSALVTIEAWIYHTISGSLDMICANQRNSSEVGFQFYTIATDQLRLFITKGSTGVAVVEATTTATIPINEWVHVCVEWDYVSDAGTFYINGAVDSTFSRINTATTSNATDSLYIGRNRSDTAYMWQGYISNLRISNSIVYGGAFTPSTEPLTTTSQSATNVELLTCQSNRFVDNSSNGYSETANGDVKVTPFSPFAPSAAWSAATNGGSGYFDGSGDYLTAPDGTAFTVGSGDWTLETWIYLTASGAQKIAGQINSSGATASLSFGIALNASTQFIVEAASGATYYSAASSSAIKLNSWTHIAAVRDGTNIRIYVNGTQANTVAVSTSSLNDSSVPFGVGRYGDLNSNYFNGYIASLNYVKGTCLYPNGTAFTPPTSPTTAHANTQLLCNFTNAGIYDNTGKNVLETVGNAQIDTTVKKYGTGSMEFDGSGDYLLLNGGENFIFGTGDFTIEFWIYFNATSGNPQIISFNPLSTNGAYPLIYIGASTTFTWYISNAARITGTTVPSTSTWYHVAVCRSGTSTKLFVNGTQEGSTYTDSNNYLVGANRPVIGAGGFNLLSPLNGLIDDLRITKGVARYTTTFTPPTKAFPDL